MAQVQILILLISLLVSISSDEIESEEVIQEVKHYKNNTVVIAILIRNKAHTLPYFFTCLERLDYPKDRLILW